MNAPSSAPVQGQGAQDSGWTAGAVAAFFLISLIWGSTWIVIRDQISTVPPAWSVTYRFAVAAAAMFAIAALRRQTIALGARGHVWAALIGLAQFMLNFNLVYVSELYITSGLVAVIFALLMVPNALLARIFLGQRMSRAFLIGTALAILGVALLFVQEYRLAARDARDVALGVALGGTAVLCASAANVMQAAEGPRAYPILSLLAWAMLWGAAMDAAYALIVAGPPTVEARAAYLGGIAYLGMVGSAVAFPLYFWLIRQIGPARAAYTGIVIPMVAMGLSTLFEGFRWSPLAIAGAVLALAGLTIAVGARRPRAPRMQG